MANSSRGRGRSGLFLSLMLSGAMPVLALSAASPAEAQEAAAREFDIPAQPLADALHDYMRQSGVQVGYPAGVEAGVTSGAVKGTYGSVEALSRLLAGTGLTYRFTGGATATLEPTGGAGDGAMLLGPVRVGGETLGSSTEGTGSYTTGSMNSATPFGLSIRETPQSVTVITRQRMDDQGIDDFIDIVENTTGLSLNRYESNRASLFARGFKISSYLIDGMRTGINEQWSAGEVQSNLAIYDRIEVLRGSDGLMVGTGNPSAVVNMVRKQADSDVLTGSFSAKLGSWDRYGLTGDVSSPLTQSGATRARVVVDYDAGGSYLDRLENKNLLLYGTLQQDIGERSLLSLGVSYQDSRSDSPTWGGLPAWTVEAGAPRRLEFDRETNFSPNWTYWDTEYVNGFVSLQHDFGSGWNAKATYTRAERNSEAKIALYYLYPIDPVTGQSAMTLFGMSFFTPGYAGIYFVDNIRDDISLQVSGELELFGRKHQLAFGYDWSRENFHASRYVGTISQAQTPSVFDFDPNVPATFYTDNLLVHYDTDVTQESFYAAGRFEILDPLKLILGARLISYNVVERDSPSKSFDTDAEFLPYAGVVLDLTQNLTAYASYTTIFEPQNYRDADNKLLSPIEGNTMEIGLKGEFFDGRLNAAFSYFWMRQENVALYVGRATDDPARSVYEGVDGYESEGFEIEVSGEILPDWQLSAGYSEFDAHASSGTPADTLIPRRQFNLFTTYRLPGEWRNLMIGGGARWRSEVYKHQLLASVLGLPVTEADAYTVVDVMARYEFNDAVSAQLNVNNLFDEKYYAPTDDGLQVYWQEPRNVQLKMRYHF